MTSLFIAMRPQHYGRLDTYIDADFRPSQHIIGGPKGVGALIVSAELEPYLKGGMQERGSRAGTCNVPAVVAMGAAAAKCGKMSCSQRDDFETILLRAGARSSGRDWSDCPTLVRCSLSGDMLV